MARAPDGRVVFVRHALPGERVVAQITEERRTYLRADAVDVLEPSSDRVGPPCALAGPGRCGGCDWQHVALPAQRKLKEQLVAEQLGHLAGIERHVEVAEVPGAPDGLAWRTRARFAVDRAGRVGFHRHRSTAVEPVRHCPIVTVAVDGLALGSYEWSGFRTVEAAASPDGGPPVVSLRARRGHGADPPALAGGLVVDGRVIRRPDSTACTVLGHRFEVSTGVFWQVHPGAASVLATAVLDGLGPAPGETVVDLYAGAGLFSVLLCEAVGPAGSVVAVERNSRAAADLRRNAAGFDQLEVVEADVTAELVGGRIGHPDLVVLDPPRAGAGIEVMTALASLDPTPRRIVYVSCEPSGLARDLKVALAAGWSLASLSGFDLFPMTEHVELVATLDCPAG